VQLAWDDCLDANLCTQSLSHPPWEFLALLTCHACRSPLGRDPYQLSLSQWLFNGGAYYRIPTPHARVPRKTTLFIHLYCWGVEARGLHALPWCRPLLGPLTREPKETPSYPSVFSMGPHLRGPTMLTLVNVRGRGPIGTQIIVTCTNNVCYLLVKVWQNHVSVLSWKGKHPLINHTCGWAWQLSMILITHMQLLNSCKCNTLIDV